MYKDIKVISIMMQADIITTHVDNCDNILVDERVDIVRDCVYILHHFIESMYHNKLICQKFLRPTFKVVYTTIVLEYFLNGTTIA